MMPMAARKLYRETLTYQQRKIRKILRSLFLEIIGILKLEKLTAKLCKKIDKKIGGEL